MEAVVPGCFVGPGRITEIIGDSTALSPTAKHAVQGKAGGGTARGSYRDCQRQSRRKDVRVGGNAGQVDREEGASSRRHGSPRRTICQPAEIIIRIAFQQGSVRYWTEACGNVRAYRQGLDGKHGQTKRGQTQSVHRSATYSAPSLRTSERTVSPLVRFIITPFFTSAFFRASRNCFALARYLWSIWVITSPGLIPLRAAGVPSSTATTTTPWIISTPNLVANS